ncbi:MAG: rod shape-determining protein [Gammaproteobacteria bacterium]|nr:rod shape-determining protein [Gammaproteobacteria bacterium]
MLKKLINRFGTTVYAQIWENRLKLTDISTGGIFDVKPLVATELDEKGKLTIINIGDAAASKVGKNISVINPFSHPRVLFSDFFVGEKLLQYGLKKLLGNKIFSPAPAVLLHPMEKTDGGLTMIEVRAFKELAFGAGARDAVIYQGKTLSVHEIDFEEIKAQVDEQ